MTTIENRGKAAQKVTFLGMIANFILLISKFIVGVLGGSAALVADAIHSLSDFISDIIIIIGFKLTSKPADEDHNYGHGKIETISAVLIGLFLIGVSIGLFYSSGTTVYEYFFEDKELKVPKFFVLYAVIFSLLIKEALYHITKHVGRKINSEALIANAWHQRSDALSSVAALIGIILALSLGEDFAVADPIASLVVSAFIFKVGLGIIISSYKQLIDTSLSEDDIIKIDGILKGIVEIRDYHNIKTRKIGYYASIDVHILVNKDLNVEQAHNIATNLENQIYQTFGESTFISVHIEPYYEDNPEKNKREENND